MPLRFAAAAVLALVLWPRCVPAVEEPLGAHTQHAPKTIVIDNDHLEPSSVDMSAQDAVLFENHSTRPIAVTFTEPADLRDRIRCGLILGSAKERTRAPWQLFAWQDGKLAATIPPGRFASLCSLQAGNYSFLIARLGPGVNPAGGKLPDKGQITVK